MRHPRASVSATATAFIFNVPFCLSPSPLPRAVPGAPPRKVEAEQVNSTAVRVTWKAPLSAKQHGQIRGYQVIYSRLEDGEPHGQPSIMDVALPEAQVLLSPNRLPTLNGLSHLFTLSSQPKSRWQK